MEFIEIDGKKYERVALEMFADEYPVMVERRNKIEVDELEKAKLLIAEKCEKLDKIIEEMSELVEVEDAETEEVEESPVDEVE